ncbi:MAG TPA: phosphopyruvate hydratase [Candidatus Paceibacterota bacterium]|nr:phosphopyruvate hydratase [Candidatus Pacearchaeota archaeon]HPZ74439.1 phosphopyruvate hydratase [Candidatus Pacearchaeota archaeon]HQD89185.1 phosphopyruvate hydratase [Candidatus Pacearchaeota archaeon]HRR39167.1 phosphopyruvate hydratase [Candidatus Paceibacterota bacterium]
MEKIKRIKAIEILNSRSNTTVKIEIASDNFTATAAVPEGKSVGKYEALSLPAWKAIKNVEEKIAPLLIGKEVNFQLADKTMIELDGTRDKSNLGVNAILGVSLAIAKLQAKIEQKPLFEFLSQFFLKGYRPGDTDFPFLLMNIVNGGIHAFGGPDIQEYLIIVKGDSLKDGVFLGARIYQEMGKFFKGNIGDEGGFVPQTSNVQLPIEAISQTVSEKLVRNKIKIGLDLAASQLFDGKKYNIGEDHFSPEQLIDLYLRWANRFEIIYLEDPFSENDPNSFTQLKKQISNQTLVVGDDLTVTNIERLKEAKEKDLISGIIVKPNQIGTLSETIEVINFAQKNDIKVIISHRSGETNDTFIADLAIASNAWGLKSGAPARGERVAKYNRLLEIEEIKK